MGSRIFYNGTDLPISVDLQDPFSYSKLPIWITVAVIVASIVVLVLVFLLRKLLRKDNGAKTPEVPVFRPKSLPVAKNEYLAKINAVEPSWKISYEFTDNIPLPSSGKLRASVREFPLSGN